MLRTFATLCLLGLPVASWAQDQQAGTATDTDAAFQALIDACDDTDALMLRARIRLQLPRTTDEAASTAQGMMTEAFTTCGEGDADAAKAQLAEALEIAEAGAAEVFDPDAEVEVTEVDVGQTPEPVAEDDASTPWWKFW